MPGIYVPYDVLSQWGFTKQSGDHWYYESDLEIEGRPIYISIHSKLVVQSTTKSVRDRLNSSLGSSPSQSGLRLSVFYIKPGGANRTSIAYDVDAHGDARRRNSQTYDSLTEDRKDRMYAVYRWMQNKLDKYCGNGTP